jgi:hypothetical protein
VDESPPLSPTVTEFEPEDMTAVPVLNPPPPPPPPIVFPPVPPAATTKYSTATPVPPAPVFKTPSLLTDPFPPRNSETTAVKVLFPVEVKVCILYPPAVVMLPPEESTDSFPLEMGKGLLERPKLFLTLLTKGIYFSLEVEVS